MFKGTVNGLQLFLKKMSVGNIYSDGKKDSCCGEIF